MTAMPESIPVCATIKPFTTYVTTADIPEAERFDFWKDVVCENFIGVDCIKNSDHSFSGDIASTRIQGVGFSRIRNHGYKYLRTSRRIRQDAENIVFVPLAVNGTICLQQDEREVKLRPGDFTFIDSSRPYTGIKSDHCEMLVFDMPRTLWTSRIGSTEPITARGIQGDTYVGGLVSNFLRQAVTGIEAVDAMTANRLAEVALALMTTAIGDLMCRGNLSQRQTSGRLSLVYRAFALIDQNLSDSGLNPEKIAQVLGISERYLQQLFHEENTTVSNWLWQRRLEKCRQALSDQLLAQKSISEIAYSCGFNNLTHFGRRFKLAYGVTPSDFRRFTQGNKKNGGKGFVQERTRAIEETLNTDS